MIMHMIPRLTRRAVTRATPFSVLNKEVLTKLYHLKIWVLPAFMWMHPYPSPFGKGEVRRGYFQKQFV